MDRITCLIVEDNESNRILMTKILKIMEINTISAQNGIDAVEIFNNNFENFDFVILDVILPGIDGIAVASIIRDKSNIPIIVCTGDINDSTRDKLLNLKINEYILKPFNIDDLKIKIQNLIKNNKIIKKNKNNFKLFIKNEIEQINNCIHSNDFNSILDNIRKIKYIIKKNNDNCPVNELLYKLEKIINLLKDSNKENMLNSANKILSIISDEIEKLI